MIEFLYPWVFMLLPLPWLVNRWMPPRRQAAPSVQVPFLDRIQSVAEAGETLPARMGAFPWGKTLCWGLLMVSLMRPQWVQAPVSRDLPTRDLMILIDLSGSMQQQDFQNAAGESVDRLTAVKEVMGEFLLGREGDRVGLIVFGNAPFLQVPFTTDLELCRQLLEETRVGMAGPRTAFGDAIGLGLLQLQNSDAPEKTLIALTDGNDSASQVPPVEAARVARDAGVTVHTLAIGDPQTAGEDPLDETTLKEVARVGGGAYFFAGDRRQLEAVTRALDDIETRDVQRVSYRPRLELYPWTLGLAVTLQALLWLPALRLDSQAETQAHPPSRLRVNPVTGVLQVEEAP